MKTTDQFCQCYGVFPHSEAGKITGRGYVARACHPLGPAHDQFNYGGVQCIQVFKSHAGAQRHADVLTEREVRA